MQFSASSPPFPTSSADSESPSASRHLPGWVSVVRLGALSPLRLPPFSLTFYYYYFLHSGKHQQHTRTQQKTSTETKHKLTLEHITNTTLRSRTNSDKQHKQYMKQGRTIILNYLSFMGLAPRGVLWTATPFMLKHFSALPVTCWIVLRLQREHSFPIVT